MNMADKLLGILSLFSPERSIWSTSQMADSLGVSVSTAYRYCKSLQAAGLLDPLPGARFKPGPGFMHYDRMIKDSDMLLKAADPVMCRLLKAAPKASVVFLCRRFSDRILSVHEHRGSEWFEKASYERGRAIFLFKGATSKIILANLNASEQKRVFSTHTNLISQLGLGNTWPEFSKGLRAIRAAGYCLAVEEVQAGRTGIAVPILDSEKSVLGSLSIGVRSVDLNVTGPLVPLLQSAAFEIEGQVAASAANERPARSQSANKKDEDDGATRMHF
ncbi:Kip operon repressor protein (plasmid) [Aminobacter sp. MSH1]|uniref:IclR family transcriptional regulator n=1 Tax=Aminobacter sp. MSH1 TaxID=374606 RepID=UPI000D3E70DF|nr:IclR family transcriptional regulator C-terminal domain-containing protein [Aminobacter sp. MSH1]ARD70006.2 Kip operon repressor protein [Aminobacter sp. MSH1]